MALTCNIDARGKAYRLKMGLVAVAIGAVAIFGWAIPIGGLASWSVGSSLIAAGAVSIFEAWTGWCILRAMGLKTPW